MLYGDGLIIYALSSTVEDLTIFLNLDFHIPSGEPYTSKTTALTLVYMY